MRKSPILLTTAPLLLAGLLLSAVAAPPEIAYIHPDVQVDAMTRETPFMIMGEQFDEADLSVWVWEPSGEKEAIMETLRRHAAGEPLPDLPVEPPQGARRIDILDLEGQVLLAPLKRVGHRDLVWLKNDHGYSRPYLISAARPMWVRRQTVEQGTMIDVFGFGLDPEYRTPYAALVGMDGRLIELERDGNPWGGAWDARMLHVWVPPETEPGSYRLFVHNSFGGVYGWAMAGEIEVVEWNDEPTPLIDVREHGAVGDGRTNDFEAITAAMRASAESGGEVFFPAGTYMVDQTLSVPEGVVLRGEDRDASRIKGFGYDPREGQSAWHAKHRLPYSVLVLRSHTGLRELEVGGFVSKGEGRDSLIATDGDEFDDVIIDNCRFKGTAFHAEYGNRIYLGGAVFSRLGMARWLRLSNNEFHGGVRLGTVHRSDVVNNRFHGGGIFANAYESTLDGNFFRDAPGRVLFYTRRASYVRYNEMHGRQRDSWPNQPEPFLVHGGGKSGRKIIGSPTEAVGDSLTDASQSWQPGEHRDKVVLISAGRGFGQYRVVMDNTEDTLLLERVWRVEPDATSEYSLGEMHVDSAFYANTSDSPGVLSLWLDCINITVEKYRSLAGGMNVWGSQRTILDEDEGMKNEGEYNPSWYNMFVNNWLDGTGLNLHAYEHPDNSYRGPSLFGTYVLANSIRYPHLSRNPSIRSSGMALANLSRYGGVVIGGTDQEFIGAARYSILSNNLFESTTVGVEISNEARNTFLLENVFYNVEYPVVDRGSKTIGRGNMRLSMGPEGREEEALPDIDGERDRVEVRPQSQ